MDDGQVATLGYPIYHTQLVLNAGSLYIGTRFPRQYFYYVFFTESAEGGVGRGTQSMKRPNVTSIRSIQ
jgi:hypothetical protein